MKNDKRDGLNSEEKIKIILIDTLINMLCFIAILLEYMTGNFKISIAAACIIVIIIYFLKKRPKMIVQLGLIALFVYMKFGLNTSEEVAKILLIQSALVEMAMSIWIISTFYYDQKTKKKKKVNQKITKCLVLAPRRKFL